jgi:ribosomal protein S6E (S10)
MTIASKNTECWGKTDVILQILRITGGNDKQGFPMKQGVVRCTV